MKKNFFFIFEIIPSVSGCKHLKFMIVETRMRNRSISQKCTVTTPALKTLYTHLLNYVLD